MSNYEKRYLKIVCLLAAFNLAVTVTVDRFTNDTLTETQLFKRIPKTFFWNFENE